MNDVITKESCDNCRNNFQRQITESIRVSEKRLDAHANQIDHVDKLMERVVALQEVQTKQLDASEKRLQIVEKQMVEIAQSKKEPSEAKESKAERKEPIWKEKWFFFIVVTLCVILVLIVGAAVGQNMLKEYIEYLKSVK